MTHINTHRILRNFRGLSLNRAAQDRLLRKALAAGGGGASRYTLNAMASDRRRRIRRSD